MRAFGLLSLLLAAGAPAAAPQPAPVPDAWRPVTEVRAGGLLGDRLRLWREKRLWRVAGDAFLLQGFESPPGRHPWQGEHVGKWLHAATLAHQATRDAKLLARLTDTARRLVASQKENGYIGTYAPEMRFFAPPGKHTRYSWDVWTARYVLYGLLEYERYNPDPAVLRACVRLGGLLADTFGPGKADVTSVGTRHGLSSAVLLESILMLYERTGERRFLDFAWRIHTSIEANEKLAVIRGLNAGRDVSIPGDGKAYQLMATLLGYGELYRWRREPSFLRAMVRAWENIRRHHLYETGGPWTYKSDAVKNNECFAPPEFYHPANVVETCSTTTWIQLSLQLLRLTGHARYGAEAERAVLNHLVGAQSPNGIEWSYFTAPNCARREYNDVIHCCGSSGPRALEMYARHLAGVSGGALSLNSYLPVSARLSIPGLAAQGFVLEGNYPFDDRAFLRLELKKPSAFAVDFRLPAGAETMDVLVGGRRQPLRMLPSGFLRLHRTWRPDETVLIRFRFPLSASYHSARDGRRWVVFTRGPLALAQDAGSRVNDDEFALPAAREIADGGFWLEPQAAAGAVSYRMKATGAILVPYYEAGSRGGAVRTYFPLRKP